MTVISIIVGIIGSLLVLCQWFVFQTLRYLFQKSEPIRRRVAYPMLIAFGLVTIVAARLEYGSEIFEPGTQEQQLAATIIFSYLGWVLVVSVFFLIVRIVHVLIELLQTPSSREASWLWNRNQCGNFSFHSLKREKDKEARTREREEQSLSLSKFKGAVQLDCLCPTRRAFLKAAAGSGLIAATGAAGWGISGAYSAAVVEKHVLFHHLLEGMGKPFTIIHVTDLHFGKFRGQRELWNLVQQLNSLEGDALFITGDIFHSARAAIEQATPILKELKARLLGNFAVLGNHDFYAGEHRSSENLKASGIILLRNQWITFRMNNATIHLGGVDDPVINPQAGNQFQNFISCLNNVPTEPGLRILLSHRPSVFPFAAKKKIDLILAGHFHGGQIVMPIPGGAKGMSVADAFSDHTYGWYADDLSRMYVNRGIGLSFLPWRIQCPPEIALIQISCNRFCDLRKDMGLPSRWSGGNINF